VTSQESSACRVSAHSVDGIAKVTAVNAVNERGVVKTWRRKLSRWFPGPQLPTLSTGASTTYLFKTLL
jgi:hypothetical protein